MEYKNLSDISNIMGNWNHLKIIQTILGKHEIKGPEKAAMLGTAHKLRKVLMLRYRTCNIGNSTTCSINCDCSIAATLYTVVYMVCFRYIIVNTPHTGGCGGDGGGGDDDDNNNNDICRTKVCATRQTAWQIYFSDSRSFDCII